MSTLPAPLLASGRSAYRSLLRAGSLAFAGMLSASTCCLNLIRSVNPFRVGDGRMLTGELKNSPVIFYLCLKLTERV